MQTECCVKNFALVNVHHSESSFSKLCHFVKEDLRLKEINVSWQSLRPVVFA